MHTAHRQTTSLAAILKQAWACEWLHVAIQQQILAIVTSGWYRHLDQRASSLSYGTASHNGMSSQNLVSRLDNR